MTITIKQTFTRPTLHDFFWFEHPFTNDELANFNSFSQCVSAASSPTWDYSDLIKHKQELRPDIVNMLESGEIQSPTDIIGEYNPTSLVFEINLIFEDLETFKQASRELFNSNGTIILERIKQTNNIVQEKIYDENGIFLENGLFNQE